MENINSTGSDRRSQDKIKLNKQPLLINAEREQRKYKKAHRKNEKSSERHERRIEYPGEVKAIEMNAYQVSDDSSWQKLEMAPATGQNLLSKELLVKKLNVPTIVNNLWHLCFNLD